MKTYFDAHCLRRGLLATGMVCAATLMAGCADDNEPASPSNLASGDAVAFAVGVAQPGENTSAAAPTRAAFAERLRPLGLAPEDLTRRTMAGETSDGTPIVIEETVVPNTDPMPTESAADRHTRATVVTTQTLGNFTTSAIRSNAESGGFVSWFYAKNTMANGTLDSPEKWDMAQPYAQFAALYPQLGTNAANIKLSPETSATAPYVDFDNRTDVRSQQDLMTAHTGVVHYAEKGTAPVARINFTHALTGVRFRGGSKLTAGKTVKKVEIIDAMSKGRYTMPAAPGDRGKWSNLSSPATFTLDGLSAPTTSDETTIIVGTGSDNGVFYMVPQQLQGLKIKVTFTDNSFFQTQFKSGEWRPHTIVTYGLRDADVFPGYTLNITSPNPVEWTGTASDPFKVESYETTQDGVQVAVPWRITGYEESTDGGKTWNSLGTSLPSWVKTLSKTEGTGATTSAGETGTASLEANRKDELAKYNKALQEGEEKGSQANPYNLANQTNGGDNVENTANSYVISAPGWYRIPLVYGNGIKNGSNNTTAYTGFSTHVAGRNIKKPYINEEFTARNNQARNAELVWEYKKGTVSQLTIPQNTTPKFVQFYVSKQLENGNAVIAVKNNSGVIMWSWHLWFAKKDVLAPIPVKNHEGKTYNFAMLPLGFAYKSWWKSENMTPRLVRAKVEQYDDKGIHQTGYITITQNPGESKEMTATYYQWGRKDPLPGIDGLNMSAENTAYTLSLGIQNPNVMYMAYPAWFNVPSNLWSSDNSASGEMSSAEVNKTVYDPSPVGYKMPPPGAFTGFSKNGANTRDKAQFNIVGDWNGGWHFNTNTGSTFFIPAFGYRFASQPFDINGKWTGTPPDGKIYQLGELADYWTMMPINNSPNSKVFSFNDLNSWKDDPKIHVDTNNGKAHGMSVLPILESDK